MLCIINSAAQLCIKHCALCIEHCALIQRPFPIYNKIEEASEPPPHGIAMQR